MSHSQFFGRGRGAGRHSGGKGRGGQESEAPRLSKPAPPQPTCLDAAGLDRLDRGLAAIDARLTDAALRDDIISYVKELELWNPRLGLVESSGSELVVKHLLDCLAAVPVLLERLEARRQAMAAGTERSMSIADIGSGAGLPGVLLALALRCLWPHPATVTLVEKQQRRVGFLLNVKALLGISSLEVVQDSLEAVGAQRGGAFDLVTARAFRPLEPVIVRELGRLLRPDGELFLYKGRRDRVDEELAAAGLAGGAGGAAADQVAVRPLAVPFLEEERHLVLAAAEAVV
jgi:16S rRNA (guanine527-N7)-methyltransferase